MRIFIIQVQDPVIHLEVDEEQLIYFRAQEILVQYKAKQLFRGTTGTVSISFPRNKIYSVYLTVTVMKWTLQDEKGPVAFSLSTLRNMICA